MSLFANIGYKFPIAEGVSPAGSVLLASTMSRHQIQRRKDLNKHSHLKSRMFDPQLYLAGLDANRCERHCARLASYPWFGVGGMPNYDSGEHHQSQWMAAAASAIPKLWRGVAPTDPDVIAVGVRECINFQLGLGCAAIILPSPLTTDPSTDYAVEEAWLDAGLSYLESIGNTDRPVFATVAIADICVRYVRPSQNPFLGVVSDAVSARDGIDGIYIVLEQGSEAAETRHYAGTRGLQAVLRLVHLFAKDAKLRVGVNFLGAFGLACEAAGAEWWATNWYKSLYRLRLADSLGKGRSYPLYWSYPAALDVHLDSDFDTLRKAGMLASIAEPTPSSAGLFEAASAGRPVSRVPAWTYRSANVQAAMDHYLESCAKREAKHSEQAARVEHVDKWLAGAVKRSDEIAAALGSDAKTNSAHVRAWFDAFRAYREDHKV